MYGLIYKNFLVNKKVILLHMGVFVFMYAISVMPVITNDETTVSLMPTVQSFVSIISVISSFMIIGSLETAIFEPDERKKWSYFISCTEAGCKAETGAKYLTIYIISTVSAVLSMIIISVISDFSGTQPVYDLCIFTYMFQLFLRAVEIPFIFRFGRKMGNNIKGIIYITGLLIAVIYFLFGDLSAFGTVDEMWEKFFALFDTGLNPKIVIVLSVAGLLVVPFYYLSYKISCKLFMRGVDNYER